MAAQASFFTRLNRVADFLASLGRDVDVCVPDEALEELATGTKTFVRRLEQAEAAAAVVAASGADGEYPPPAEAGAEGGGEPGTVAPTLASARPLTPRCKQLHS